MMLVLATVKLPALLAWIRLDPKLRGPVELIVVWLIDNAPTDAAPPVAVTPMVSLSKVIPAPVRLVWVMPTELALMVLPVKEIVSAPRFKVVLADKLLWVMPLGALTLRALVADKLMVLVPLVMAPVAVKLVWLMLALAAVKLPALLALMRSVPKLRAPVELIIV